MSTSLIPRAQRIFQGTDEEFLELIQNVPVDTRFQSSQEIDDAVAKGMRDLPVMKHKLEEAFRRAKYWYPERCGGERPGLLKRIVRSIVTRI